MLYFLEGRTHRKSEPARRRRAPLDPLAALARSMEAGDEAMVDAVTALDFLMESLAGGVSLLAVFSVDEP